MGKLKNPSCFFLKGLEMIKALEEEALSLQLVCRLCLWTGEMLMDMGLLWAEKSYMWAPASSTHTSMCTSGLLMRHYLSKAWKCMLTTCGQRLSANGVLYLFCLGPDVCLKLASAEAACACLLHLSPSQTLLELWWGQELNVLCWANVHIWQYWMWSFRK